MPRHWHLYPQGPTRWVFGCAAKAVGRLQSHVQKRILRDLDAEHHQVPERSVLSIPLGVKRNLRLENIGCASHGYLQPTENTSQNGGEDGIRTHGTVTPYNGFRVLRFSCRRVSHQTSALVLFSSDNPSS